MDTKHPAIGIDLGTTFTCVAVFQYGRVEMIPNDQGHFLTPSCVAFNENDRLIGDPAMNQSSINPENTVVNIKRLLGRNFGDPNIQENLKYLSYKVVDVDDKPKICLTVKGEKKLFSPEELGAMILGKIKEVAQDFLRYPVKDAVITVPAYFNNSQRQATKDAGRIAGLNVLRIINEPTAAALAYGLHRHVKEDRNILVYDLGGGTFDVSILTVHSTFVFEVRASAGNNHLGGEDFDNKMVTHFVMMFNCEHKKDLTTNIRAMRRLKNACEIAKKALSSCFEANIDLDYLMDGIDFSKKITRAEFEGLCIGHFRSTVSLVEKALEDCKIDKNSIHDVVLVGGSTRIPKIRKLMQDFFNGKELCTSISADEAVAKGAAVMAGILNGDIDNVFLVDITTISLGLKSTGGIMTTVIKKHTPVPCREAKLFSTASDNQKGVVIKVFEGEGKMISDNHYLGSFRLGDIGPARKGAAQIEVTFDVNKNGILQVSATDKHTGNCESIYITNSKCRLSEDNITKMILEAGQYEEEDQQRKDRVEAKNNYQNFVYKFKEAAENASEYTLSTIDKVKVKDCCDSALHWIAENPLAEKDQIDKHMKDSQVDLLPFITKIAFHQ